MSNLELQNLSNPRSTNSLTREETSLIMGGISSARTNFLESLFDDAAFEDISDLEASFPSKLNSGKSSSKRRRFRKGSKPKAGNVIFGTPGDDVLIGN